LHALDVNLLDDHVAPAYRGHHLLSLDPDVEKCGAHRLANERRIHHLALHDGVRGEGDDARTDELRLSVRMIDHGHLHVTRTNVQADRRLLATEESHGGCGVRCDTQR